MARVAGVEIPNDKRCEVALTKIYGIGKSLANYILQIVGIENKLVRDLSEQELKKIRDCIADKEFLVEGGLRASIAEAIKRIKDIGCYRGKRHKLGLPVRGQRTKNNCRTLKGVRKTVANKKIATR